jgi:hypothetical protein
MRVARGWGTGSVLPAGRWECARRRTSLVRINPGEAQGPPGTVGLACGALEALRAIEEAA